MAESVPIPAGPAPPPRRGARVEGMFGLVMLLVGVALPCLALVWYWIAPVAFLQHGIDRRTILFVLMCGVFTTLATLLSVGARRTGARRRHRSQAKV